MYRCSSSRPERRVQGLEAESRRPPRTSLNAARAGLSLRPAAPDFERPEPGFELEETADRLEQPGELRGARRQAGRVPENDARVGAVFQGRGVACDQRRDVIHPQTIRVDG